MHLPPAIKEAIERELSTTILKVSPLSGGDINIAGLLHTSHGNFFVKINDSPDSERILQTEAKGLKLLKKSNKIGVAKVMGQGNTATSAWLLLDYIPQGTPSPKFWELFGHALANLHRQTNNHYGLDHHNFIGSLPQYNDAKADGIDFLIHQRLYPQLEMALNSAQLNSRDAEHFEHLFKQFPDMIPNEPPSLIHGDLWSGNFICSEKGQSILIDPAVSFAHREMDLAMSRLFGGFAQRFYAAYEESYPTAPGLEQRIGIYQLYYLLVHVNIFGRGYVGQVRSVLSQYF
ncbi:MAG: fructosamine kinase family protein [Saprospiraceae bacterium]|nr:fructosamine kinase family protein [Saprospiraceae bacterium]MCB9323108.1 fructosamine kinase family protein [Lewinellaceae bacterium]